MTESIILAVAIALLVAIGGAARLVSQRTLRWVVVAAALLMTGLLIWVGRDELRAERIDDAKGDLIVTMGERCSLSSADRRRQIEAHESAGEDLEEAQETTEAAIATAVAARSSDATPDVGSLLETAAGGDVAALDALRLLVVSDEASQGLDVAIEAIEAQRAAQVALDDQPATPQERPELVTLGQWVWASWPEDVKPDEQVPELTCLSTSADSAADPTQDADWQAPRDWGADTPLHGDGPHELAENRAGVALALARAEHALATGDARKTAAATVDARRDELVAVAAGDADPDPPSAFAALAAGADAVLPFESIVLTTAGWTVIAALLAWFLRRQLTVAAEANRGPVTIDAPDGLKGDLRTYIARNVPEPGLVPGAEAMKPVTDILEAGGVVAANPLVKAVTSVIEAMTVRGGYTVTVTEMKGEAAAAASDGPASDAGTPGKESSTEQAASTHLSVIVTRTSTGAQLDQRIVRGTHGSPVRAAAYWAASVILDRSPDVPPWAEWAPDASDALTTFFAKVDTGTEPTSEDLDRALRQAPANGLLLMTASHHRALQGRPVDSLLLSLRAVAAHPQYRVARYRLAVGMSILSEELGAWKAAAPATRHEVLVLLGALDGSPSLCAAARCTSRYLGALHAGGARAQDVEARGALIALGRECAEQLRADLAWHRLVPRLWHRRERKATWDLLTQRTDAGDRLRHRLQLSALAVEAVAHARLGQAWARREAELRRRVSWRRGDWQTAYNLACLHSVVAGQATTTEVSSRSVDLAYESMWMALSRPGSQALTATWLEQDPDLVAMRGDDGRFAELLERTRTKERDDRQPH